MIKYSPMRFFAAVIFVLLLFFSATAYAKDESVQVTQADGFGRDTPRGTVEGFVASLLEDDMKVAAKYLDDDFLKDKDDDEKAQIIYHFRNVLDVAGQFDNNLHMSAEPMGNLADKLPIDQEKVGVIATEDGEEDIILVQKGELPNTYWQFSTQTLQNLPDVQVQTDGFLNRFDVPVLKARIFSYSLSDIIGLIVLIALSLLVVYLWVWVVFVVVNFIYPKFTHKKFFITPAALLPLSVVIVTLLLPHIMFSAGVPVTLRTSILHAKTAVAWFASTWLVFRLIDALFGHASKLSLKNNHPEQLAFIGLFKRLAKVFMLVLAVIISFGNLGFDLTTGIAALGIGGIALAFGAQKTLENLIGSVVVVADRPVRVGDYCKFGTYEGHVIDIGIRSTRVRTLNRTVVTIPNGEFAALQIENYATRDMFHFLQYFYVDRCADVKILQQMIDDTHVFLHMHEYTTDGWTQVRISATKQDSFELEVRTYIDAIDVAVFYEKQTRLILQLTEFMRQYDVPQVMPGLRVRMEDAPVYSNSADVPDENAV